MKKTNIVSKNYYCSACGNVFHYKQYLIHTPSCHKKIKKLYLSTIHSGENWSFDYNTKYYDRED